MIHSEQADPFIAHVRETCGPNGRYRTLWLIRNPESGNSTFAREVSERAGWHYLNYTIDPRGLATLAGNEGVYQPSAFVRWMTEIAAQVENDIIVIDEIEPLLAWLDFDKLQNFLRTVSRARNLSKGFVLVTRLRSAANRLPSIVPNRRHFLRLDEVLQWRN